MFRRRTPSGPGVEAGAPPPPTAPAGSAAMAAAPAPDATPAPARPEPPAGARHLVVVTFDSLRWDSFMAASPRLATRLGDVERRFSYASWTAPSHYNLLMGLLPHTSPPHVYASEYYKEDFLRYQDRLGVPGVEFGGFLPSIFLPVFLTQTLGYTTHAMVSMPVLNRHTPVNRGFDTYELMPRHNDFGAMIDRLHFDGERPTFHLLNVGETHYPYATADEDPSEWPRISGVHGVIKRLDASAATAAEEAPQFFDAERLEELRRRQVRAAAHVDGLLERLFDAVPENTWVIVTSDHGELFGEEGYFGHGPIHHPKVLEVPYVEGKVR